MTNDEIIDLYRKFEDMSRKDMTNAYNSLSVQDRREFSEYLRDLPDNKKTFSKFKSDISQQAIDDFGYHEREAIINGTCVINTGSNCATI